MCFAHDARPPDLPRDLVLPRLAGGAGAEVVEVTSADGTRFSAAVADPGRPGAVGVGIIPDVRGLYPFYIELAERFAAAGHPAVAIDPFGRTAGLGPRDEHFEYRPHVDATRPESVQADLGAALALLAQRTGSAGRATVGFCFGGRHAFLAATNSELALDGAIGFYAALDPARLGDTSPLFHTAEILCPVLGLFGGADRAIPTEQVEEFDRRLGEAGVPHEVVVYPGAPHSFFDRSYEEHAEASEDAWRRVLGFLATLARAEAGART
jgi:carboxymethylenebutenolidase